MEPASKIESVKIQGFRSLADVELTDLPNAAVLIGPNGSGKSNVFLFLEMLQQMLRYRRLAQFVARHGGADDQLFGGSVRTETLVGQIEMKTELGRYDYECSLSRSFQDQLIVDRETFGYLPAELARRMARDIHNWGRESGLLFADRSDPDRDTVCQEEVYIQSSLSDFRDMIEGWAFHQFHNTDFNSSIKKNSDVEDNIRLKNRRGKPGGRSVQIGTKRPQKVRLHLLPNTAGIAQL